MNELLNLRAQFKKERTIHPSSISKVCFCTKSRETRLMYSNWVKAAQDSLEERPVPEVRGNVANLSGYARITRGKLAEEPRRKPFEISLPSSNPSCVQATLLQRIAQRLRRSMSRRASRFFHSRQTERDKNKRR